MRCGDVLVAVGPLDVAVGPLDVAETVVLRLDCHAGLGLRIVSGVLSYAGDVGGALRAFEQSLLTQRGLLFEDGSESFVHSVAPIFEPLVAGRPGVERIRRRRYMLSNLQMIEEALRP